MEDGGIDIQRQSKYFFIALFVLIVLVSLFLIKSFVITIITGVLITYIFYPLYKKILNALRSENLAAFITILIVVIIIFIPLIFVANALINQSIQFFYRAKEFDFSRVSDVVSRYVGAEFDIAEYVADTLNTFSLSIAKNTSEFIVSLPKKMLAFFVILFIMFYLFKEGKTILEKIKDHIPLKESYRRPITERFNSVIYATLYGIVVTAFIQGAVGTLGLWVFGVPSPILWGMVMVILAMLPFVGAAFVWFPAAVYKIFAGELVNGIGLLFYGLLIVSTIDNIIRPKIIGSKGKIHPILVLLGVLGGLEVFGLFGVIIGPLILAILTVFLELYIGEKKELRVKSA